MVDFEPPSFSLGLDFALDSEPQTTVTGNPSSGPAPQSPTSPTLLSLQDLNDDDFESPTLFPAPDRQSFNPPRSLKRLRRRPTRDPALAGQKRDALNLVRKCKEIEEFSSQEDSRIDKPPSKHYPSECSILKFPLPGPGIFIEQLASNIKQVSNAPASANLKTSSSNRACPNSTASPSRKFQLIDSDSDDPFVGKGTTNIGTNNERLNNPGRRLSSSKQGKTEASRRITMKEDLRDDFCLEERCNLPTPAFDEVCEEYFKSMQNKIQSTNCEQQLNSGSDLPPFHRYYFHGDPRIQNLVQSRLPNFLPLGAVNNMQPSTSDINYMSQFSHGDGKNNSVISSGKKQSSSKKSNPEEVSEGYGSWVNPKDCAATPKNAVKRKASAVGESAGHWYTASNGKRVYVSKKGQELTGQTAYRNYKKESGAGSNRSKKKGGAGAGSKRTKKKNGAGSKKLKKKSTSKKK